MQFIADRKQMLAVCKNLARLLPDKSPIEDLTGILIDADENSGAIKLTAVTMELMLQYRLPASVGTGGRMVLNGRLLAEMMPLLSGEKVSFETRDGSNVAHINCDNTIYQLLYLKGKHFPEKDAEISGDSFQLSGIASLVKQTVFAARSRMQSSDDLLTNAKLDIYPGEMHITCTDGVKLATARRKQENKGQTRLLIPVKTLSLLAGICGDEAVSVKNEGSRIVFEGENFTFAARTMSGEFMDTNALLSKIKPVYIAIVNAREFWSDVDRMTTLAEPGDTVLMAFCEDGIAIRHQNENGSFSTISDAVVYNAMSGDGIHYSVSEMHQALRHIDGNLQISIDSFGNMLLKGSDLCYFLSFRRQRKVSAKPDTKKKKTTKAVKKAA